MFDAEKWVLRGGAWVYEHGHCFVVVRPRGVVSGMDFIWSLWVKLGPYSPEPYSQYRFAACDRPLSSRPVAQSQALRVLATYLED